MMDPKKPDQDGEDIDVIEAALEAPSSSGRLRRLNRGTAENTADRPPASTPSVAFSVPVAGPVPQPRPSPAVSVKEEEIPSGDQFQTAILGPGGSGKTYLFQAIVHRLSTQGQQGVMTRYMAAHGLGLWEKTVTPGALSAGSIDYSRGVEKKPRLFNAPYLKWERLPHTEPSEFNRYTLVLNYRKGIRGEGLGALRLSFIDCAGELHDQGIGSDPLANEAWAMYRDARVVVFCLQTWAAFPGELTVLNKEANPAEARAKFYRKRKESLTSFAKIVENYTKLWKEGGRRPVRVVLALTQADSPLTGLQTLAERWVRSYMKDSERHLAQLASVGGPTRYLSAARQISNYLADEFAASEDREVRRIPLDLTYEGRGPWIIPVSAIDGEVIEGRAQKSSQVPEPAHVELPLLLALCESHNALM